MPKGTTAVSVPEQDCVAARDGKPDYSRTQLTGAPQYLCTTDTNVLEVGQTYRWPFKLRLDVAGPTNGAVAVGDRADDRDPNPTNDTAAIQVNPAAGTGGTGGGAGTLPITGGNVGLLAGAGIALITLGAAGYLTARRRRTRFQV
jgi:hypothetical protein